MNVLHWLFGENSAIAKVFGYGKKPTPPPTPTPTPTPTTVPVAIVVFGKDGRPVYGAAVELSDMPGAVGLTNADGYVPFPALKPGTRTVTVSATGYDPYSQSIDVTKAQDFVVGGTARPDQTQLPAMTYPKPKLQRLVVNGSCFRQEDGTPFTAIQASQFFLLGRYLNGEDIRPQLQQMQDIGFNMLRVWTRMKLAWAGIGDCTLAQHPDMYDRIPAFLDLCAEYGQYVEFTAFVGPNPDGDDFDPAHWQRLGQAVQGKTNVLLELVNENDVHPLDTNPYQPIAGVLCSHGSNGSEKWPVTPYWDYGTFHTNGASEEQRKVGHNAMEIDPRPMLTDETSRYPEVGMWRSGDINRQKQLAYDSAAGAALLCAGSCFHSVAGKSSVMFDPDTETVARAWVAGAKSVDLQFQNQPYQHRTGDEVNGVLRAYGRGGSPSVLIRA